MILKFCLACIFFVATLTLATKPPIVFIPGLTESILNYKLNNFLSGYTFCKNGTTTEFAVLWPIPTLNTTEQYLCWLELFQTLFDSKLQRFTNKTGVEVVIKDFGKFSGIQQGWPIFLRFAEKGWIPGKNIFSAQYDWRYPTGGGGQDFYYTRLQSLVESVYVSNAKQKVTLLAISFGPQITLGFLHRMTQAWRDTYIKTFVAESPVWSGSPLSLIELVGKSPADGLIRQISLRAYSNFWMFPQPGNSNTTFGHNDFLITTPQRNYSAFDYVALMNDLGFEFLVPNMLAAQNNMDLTEFQPPGVDTLVTFGWNIGTPQTAVYATPFVADPNVAPTVATILNSSDTGDGVVTVRSSLRGFYDWADVFKATNKTFHYLSYKNQNHAMCIFSDADHCFSDVLNYILTGNVPPQRNTGFEYLV